MCCLRFFLCWQAQFSNLTTSLRQLALLSSLMFFWMKSARRISLTRREQLGWRMVRPLLSTVRRGYSLGEPRQWVLLVMRQGCWVMRTFSMSSMRLPFFFRMRAMRLLVRSMSSNAFISRSSCVSAANLTCSSSRCRCCCSRFFFSFCMRCSSSSLLSYRSSPSPPSPSSPSSPSPSLSPPSRSCSLFDITSPSSDGETTPPSSSSSARSEEESSLKISSFWDLDFDLEGSIVHGVIIRI